MNTIKEISNYIKNLEIKIKEQSVKIKEMQSLIDSINTCCQCRKLTNIIESDNGVISVVDKEERTLGTIVPLKSGNYWAIPRYEDINVETKEYATIDAARRYIESYYQK